MRPPRLIAALQIVNILETVLEQNTHGILTANAPVTITQDRFSFIAFFNKVFDIFPVDQDRPINVRLLE